MTEFLFPDNTVLCNFAAVKRLDLLKSVLDGRGRWTEAVAYEAARSACVLPVLSSLITGCWLGEAIEISDESDVQHINGIRRAVFGGTDDEPLKHLGEAQTCYLVNIAVINGDINARDGFNLMQQMADHGRCLRLPVSAACLQR